MAQGPTPGQGTDTWPARRDEFSNLEEANQKNSPSGGGLKNLRLEPHRCYTAAAPDGGLSPNGHLIQINGFSQVLARFSGELSPFGELVGRPDGRVVCGGRPTRFYATTHNWCVRSAGQRAGQGDRRISRSRWAGQGTRAEGIFRLHFEYRSWDRSPRECAQPTELKS